MMIQLKTILKYIPMIGLYKKIKNYIEQFNNWLDKGNKNTIKNSVIFWNCIELCLILIVLLYSLPLTILLFIVISFLFWAASN